MSVLKCFISAELIDGENGPWLFQVKRFPGGSIEAIGSCDNLEILRVMAVEALKETNRWNTDPDYRAQIVKQATEDWQRRTAEAAELREEQEWDAAQMRESGADRTPPRE